MKKAAIIESGQSLLDIAVQHCGSVEAALTIAIANGISITEAVAAGGELAVADAVNKSVVNLFAISKTNPATAITQTEALSTIADEGVEFWALEIDFIVT